jgi:hypothetical protein
MTNAVGRAGAERQASGSCPDLVLDSLMENSIKMPSFLLSPALLIVYVTLLFFNGDVF